MVEPQVARQTQRGKADLATNEREENPEGTAKQIE